MTSKSTDPEIPEPLRKSPPIPEFWFGAAELLRPTESASFTGCSERRERSIIPHSMSRSKSPTRWISRSWSTSRLSPISPTPTSRHYVFLNQGLVDIEEDLQQRQIGFIVRRPPNNSLQTLLAEVNAAMVIGDENPCREPERWRKVLAGRLRIPYWTVDADVVVPSGLFQKRMYALHIFRPKLYAELPKFLVPQPNHQAPTRMETAPRLWSHFLCGKMLPKDGRRWIVPLAPSRALPAERMPRSNAFTIL